MRLQCRCVRTVFGGRGDAVGVRMVARTGLETVLRRARGAPVPVRRGPKSFPVSLWDILTTERYPGTVEPTLPRM